MIGEFFDPLVLDGCVGDGEAAGVGDLLDGVVGGVAEADEGAGGEDGGASDAGEAVDGDALAVVEFVGELVGEGADEFACLGEAAVDDGEVVEAEIKLVADFAFVFEAGGFDVIGAEE